MIVMQAGKQLIQTNIHLMPRQIVCLSRTGGFTLACTHALFSRLFNSSTDLVVGKLQSDVVTQDVDRGHDS